MPHVDPTHMVALALGNDASHNDVSALQHLSVCKRCREELSLVLRVVAAARSIQEADLPASPPERVWQRITRELAESDEATAQPSASSLRRLSAAPAASRPTSRSPGTRHGRTSLAYVLLTGIVILWWRSRRRSRRPSGSATDQPSV